MGVGNSRNQRGKKIIVPKDPEASLCEGRSKYAGMDSSEAHELDYVHIAEKNCGGISKNIVIYFKQTIVNKLKGSILLDSIIGKYQIVVFCPLNRNLQLNRST